MCVTTTRSCLSHALGLNSVPGLPYVAVRVEIECYSVAYFYRVTAFKVPYLRTSVKGGAQTQCVIALIVTTFTQHVLAPPLTEVRRYGALNAVTQSKYATE